MPSVLRGAGQHCELHDDHFTAETPDTVWLAEVGAKNWIVLTKDERIRYRPLELRALRDAKVRAFVMICGNVRGVEAAGILMKAMSRILVMLRKKRGPFICYVYKNSSVKLAL